MILLADLNLKPSSELVVERLLCESLITSKAPVALQVLQFMLAHVDGPFQVDP